MKLLTAVCYLFLSLIYMQLPAQNTAPVQPLLRGEFLKNKDDYLNLIKGRKNTPQLPVVRYNQPAPTFPDHFESGPFDTCATHTYRLKIGNDGSDEEVTDITRLPGGEMLITGKTNKNGSQDDALLIKIDGNGDVLWMKTYGDNTSQEIFYKARRTTDGGIIVIGSSFITTVNGYILICKMDANGNLQWTRKYRSSSVNYANGADIIQLANNDFAFVGDDGKDLLYGNISVSGNLLWDQKCRLSDSTKALNIVEDYNGWLIASTGIDTGWHVANLIKVDAVSGGFLWRKRFGGSGMNANFIFHKMQFVNLRARVTGIWAMQGQPYHFIRLTANTVGTVETMEQYEGAPSPDVSASTVLTSQAEVMAFSANDHSNALTLIQNFPDVPVVDWSNTYSAGGSLHVEAIEKSADAGFLAACNVAGISGQDILLVKVDSTGLSPGCDGVPSTVSLTLQRPGIPYADFTPSAEILVQDNTPVLVGTMVLDTVYSCRQLTCPAKAPEDTCVQTFHKNYRSYSFSEISSGLTITNDDHPIMSGTTRADDYNASLEQGFIVKTDNKGNLQARLRLLVGSTCTIYQQKKLLDGNILVTGWYQGGTTDFGFFLAKFNDNLDNIWTKTYSASSHPSWSFDGIAESSDGSIFAELTWYDFGNLDDRILLLKFDNTGNILFQHFYRPAAGISLFSGGSMMARGTDLYLGKDIYDESLQNWATLVTKFDAGGNLAWSRKFLYPGNETDMRGIIPMQNNAICIHGFVSTLTATLSVFATLDNAGNVLKKTAHSQTYVSASITSASNGDILVAGDFFDYQVVPAPFYNIFQRLDSNLNVRISRKTHGVDFTSTSQVEEDPQQYLFAYGFNNYRNVYGTDLFLRKFSPLGLLGTCPSDSFGTSLQPFPLTVSDVALTSTPANAITPASWPVTISDFSLQQNTFRCGSVSGCDTIWLTGSPAVCDTSVTYTYIAHKNAGCSAPVNWLVPVDGISIQQKNDSLIELRFSKSGSYTIGAQLLTGCYIFTDSVRVTVSGYHAGIYLGPDTTLCPGNSIMLHAGNGYVTYKWQDGSADSVFKVKQPGTYFLAATDACGITFSDTIIINTHPPIPFYIGADTSICAGDTLTVTAPPGFIHYQWNTYHVTPDTGKVVKVYPDTNFMYKATAELLPGCSASDSLLVIVKHVPPVHLGNDTSFCFGQSVVLAAGNSFDTYQWNTGAATENIRVATEGAYSVTAVLNGCSSYDTLSIVHVYPLPSFSLGNDTALCTGQQLAYNFSLMQATYLWSSGSTSKGFTIVQPGMYWLSVTQQGCTDADTIQVTYNPLPLVNLGKDTTLCEPGTLLLKAYNANAGYLRQDGSTAHDYLVTHAGIYKVTATVNSCAASDTIAVNYKALPHFTLGKDTLLCSGEQYILEPSISTSASFLWQDGSAASAYTVTNPGLYYLTATNICGTYSDSISIIAGPCSIMMPSGFTPNGDGLNDVFRVKYHFLVKKFDLIIYDRWGEKVFETTDIGKGWDGTWKGLPALPGAYVWVISLMDNNNKQQQLKGVVTLLR